MYDSKSHPFIVDYIYGLGGRDTSPKDFRKVYSELHMIAHNNRMDKLVNYVGLRKRVMEEQKNDNSRMEIHRKRYRSQTGRFPSRAPRMCRLRSRNVLRMVMKATRGPTIVTEATGCMEVVSSIYPYTSWSYPGCTLLSKLQLQMLQA